MKQVESADFPAFEAEMLGVWDKEQTFEASLARREGAKPYSFYDGPPFANGLPHFGHSLVTSIKDSIGRYRTMRGYYVERRNGWDCHGLPVEFAIEKELGISGKKQIMDLGIDKFNAACRASVFKYKTDWEEFFRRIGRWTDIKHAYATIDHSYTESVWWMLGEVHKKGLLYRGYKSMPYCPRCETPLSNFEVNEGYRDNVPDPSLFVKFKLVDEDAALLAWTTTPWSLPGNAALAVDPEAVYVYARVKLDLGGWETLVLAKARLEVLKAEYEIEREIQGSELVGKRYRPLFKLAGGQHLGNYQVWAAKFVSIEDGTGVLHVAPAFGEDDLSLAQDHGLTFVTTVGPDGRMTSDTHGPKVESVFFKEADPIIIEWLIQQGVVYAAETFTHTYPFCYRCDSPLLYYAISTWFVGVSNVRDELVEAAEPINWQPGHIKTGRFGKWLEGARDWAISRNRYWGAPLPIWVNIGNKDDYIVVTSLEELVQLAGLDKVPADLHRPGIDYVVIERDGKTYSRVEEVFDCWFESGAMPAAQYHFPFENQAKFKAAFPADYVGEGLDQTRLWFYVLHVLSVVVFDQQAYKNVLVNGMVMASDGQKLSKRLKNYPPLEEVFASEGADTLRFYLLSNDQLLNADYARFNRDAMTDIHRNVFMTLWNSYSFLSMYAEIEGWNPRGKLSEPESSNPLDKWMVSRLNQTIAAMTAEADEYRLAATTRALRNLIDDLSNWYVRRSRRRFSKNQDKGDGQSAFETLHYVLVRVSQMLAPWSPFLADKLWRGLTYGMEAVESVHLTDWPEVGVVDQKMLEQMGLVRELVTQGLAQRAVAKIKVRQPLADASVTVGAKLDDRLVGILADELNVRSVSQSVGEGISITLNTEITQELQSEGLARDVIRAVQNYRRELGLSAGDRIVLSLWSEDAGSELMWAVKQFSDLIKIETNAARLSNDEGEKVVPIAGADLKIGVTRA